MIKITQLTESKLVVLIEVINAFLKHLKYQEKSTSNYLLKSVLKNYLNQCENSLKSEFSFKKVELLENHTAIVLENSIIFYLGYPFRNKNNDNLLSKIAIEIISQLKNETKL